MQQELWSGLPGRYGHLLHDKLLKFRHLWSDAFNGDSGSQQPCLSPCDVRRNDAQLTHREDGSQDLAVTCAQGDVRDLFWRDPSFPEDAVGVEANL